MPTSRGEIVEALQALVASAVGRAPVVAAAGTSATSAIVIGLIGRGIQSSRSPIMHEREGARLGMRYVYVLVDFDRLGLPDSELAAVLEGLEEVGFAGCNVTHPFKQKIMPHLTRLASDASAIGAVNTVVLKGGMRVGHNTDCFGFATSFQEGMKGCALDRIAQFGAGGAGAAISYALLEMGVERLDVIDSDGARAAALATRMAERFGSRIVASEDVGQSQRAAAGIVNTTPVGMAKYPGTPFPAEWLRASQWVAEVIYFPRETELLARARAIGCRTLAGTGMAIYQAARAFELFTGIVPDHAAMTSHFEAAA